MTPIFNRSSWDINTMAFKVKLTSSQGRLLLRLQQRANRDIREGKRRSVSQKNVNRGH